MKKKIGIIEWAMKYRQIIILFVSLLVVFGVYSLVVMPKQEFPIFTIRQGLVVGVYPGATSEEIEEQLTKPLEEFIFSFKDVNKAKTVSQSRDGMVFIMVELNDDVKNKEEFWAKFKLRLSELKASLPSGVLAVIAKDDFGDTSSILLTLESKDKSYKELEEYLKDLKAKLRKIESVSNLREAGLQKEQISVYIDQDKLALYAINNTTLAANLFSQGFTTMSGSIRNPKYLVPIHIKSTYNCEYDVAEQVVYSDPMGNNIKLKDIARIVREYPDGNNHITNNGKNCILLSMEMREGYNIVKMGKDVNKILKEFEKTLPDDVVLYKITDQSQVVGDSVYTFLKELLIAILAVILVVILLMPLRVASVAASTIPITIFISLGIFFTCGFELNTVTLAALIATLGMIVDNSIVIIDCYMEKLDKGEDNWQAAIHSAKEFFPSIFSATLAISITFFPFLITTSGTINDFLVSFPWAITIILAISLLVALLLIPYMQFFFIKTGFKGNRLILKKNEKAKRKNFLDYIQMYYDVLIEKCFKNPKKVILIGVSSVILGAIMMFGILPMRILPYAQRNQFAVEIYLPKGSSIEQTEQVADSVETILKKDKRVVSVTAFIGEGSPRFHALYAPQLPGNNYAQFIVNTKSNEDTEDILNEYTDKYLNYLPNARVRFKQLEYSVATYPIEIRLKGDNKKDLKAASEEVKKAMEKVDALTLVQSNNGEQLSGVSINLNENEISRLGINRTSVALNMAMKYSSGIPITTVWDKDYPMSVVLKSDRNHSTNFNDISNEYISAWGGASAVALRQISEVKPDWNEGNIVHRNGINSISLQSDIKRGTVASEVTKEVIKEIDKVKLPKGVSYEVGGAAEADSEFLIQIIYGLIIAILIIFFILLFHFKRINLALLILLSVTLCLFGASFGIWIMGLELSVTAILGIVSLMGIVVRNGIIMIDYAEELRKEEMNVYDAALKSAKRRMRPIFLTSAAASMGVIPMIIGGSVLWSPMGSVIFFGTIISMLLTITVLPVSYWIIFVRADKIKEKKLIKEKKKLQTQQIA